MWMCFGRLCSLQPPAPYTYQHFWQPTQWLTQLLFFFITPQLTITCKGKHALLWELCYCGQPGNLEDMQKYRKMSQSRQCPRILAGRHKWNISAQKVNVETHIIVAHICPPKMQICKDWTSPIMAAIVLGDHLVGRGCYLTQQTLPMCLTTAQLEPCCCISYFLYATARLKCQSPPQLVGPLKKWSKIFWTGPSTNVKTNILRVFILDCFYSTQITW